MRTALLVPLLVACAPEETEAIDLGAAIREDALMGHLEALEAIGAAHGSTRVSGGDGYVQSVEYVASKLEQAGYEVTLDPFETGFFRLESASVSFGDVTYTE